MTLSIMNCVSMEGFLVFSRASQATNFDFQNLAGVACAETQLHICSGQHNQEANPEARNFFAVYGRWAILIEHISGFGM